MKNVKERKERRILLSRAEKNAKNVPFFYKERKRMHKNLPFFNKEQKRMQERYILLKRMDAQPCQYPSTYLAGEREEKPQRRESPPPEGSALLSCIRTATGKPSGLSTNEEGSQETGLFLHQLLVEEGVGLTTLRPKVTPPPIPCHP